jgi:CRISPR-associated protein Cas2
MLTVFISIASEEYLRGYLDRYCVEIRAGVWIGDFNSETRRRIWELLLEKDGKALMLYPKVSSETGYHLETNQNYTRVINLDGLDLIAHKVNE